MITSTESIFKFKLMFHGIKCTEIEKKKQEPPLINSLLILLINLLYVDCCKLCSFKDLCKSDNDIAIISFGSMTTTSEWVC